MKHKNIHYSSYLLFALLTCIFLAFAIKLSVTSPLCCADDASFAVASKNMASGLGYTLTLNYRGPDYSPHVFDPALGTGPTLILSSAILIKLLGPTPWAPGVATALLCSIYIFFIGLQLKKLLGVGAGASTLTLFLITAIACTSLDFHYWSSELGEAPAALAIILGTLLWANRKNNSLYALFSGFMLSLSFLTKEISAIYVIALAIYAIANLLTKIKDASFRPEVKLFGYLCLGLCIPVFAFEAFRFISLGSLSNFTQNWNDHLEVVLSQGIGNENLSLFEKVHKRIISLENRFFLSYITLALGITVIAIHTWRVKANLREAILPLALGALLHAAYWLSASNGWPRYAVSFILAWIFLVSMSVNVKKFYGIASCGILIFTVMNSSTGLQYVLSYLTQDNQKMSMSLNDEKKVLNYIKINKIPFPIYTGWWAQVASLEYLSTTPHSFDGFQLAYQSSTNPFYIITNSAFPLEPESPIKSLKSCVESFSSGKYALYSCLHQTLETPIGDSTDKEYAPEITGFTCNIEALNMQDPSHDWRVSKEKSIRLSGWLLDSGTWVPPNDASVELFNTSLHKSWLVPIKNWASRKDVAVSHGSKAYLNSGFDLIFSGKTLPEGGYHLFLRYTSAGKAMACDNGRQLNLSH